MPGTNGFGEHTHIFVYLSRLIGRKVDLPAPHRPGKLVDIIVQEKPPYPKVTALVVRARAGNMRIDLDKVSPGVFAFGRRLDCRDAAAGPPREMMLLPDEFRVVSLLLDKQVVDVRGAKVVRVNDLQFLVDARGVFLVHVDVGARGLLRRIGLEGAILGIGRLFRRPGREDMVSWKYIHPTGGPSGGARPVQLAVSQQALHDLHPGELADILEDLDRESRLQVVSQMNAETAADVLEQVDDAVQKAIVQDLSPEVAADIVEEMEPSEATDLLQALPEEQAERIMRHVEKEEAEDIRQLSTYEEGTAGAVMTTDFIAVRPDATAGEAIEELRRQAGEVEAIYYVYLVGEGGLLSGVVSLRQLVTARPGVALKDLTEDRLVAVQPDTPLREVAQLFEKFGFLFIPVANRPRAPERRGRMLGVVSLVRALDELQEHFGQED